MNSSSGTCGMETVSAEWAKRRALRSGRKTTMLSLRLLVLFPAWRNALSPS